MVDVTDQDSAAATAQLVAFDPHIVLLQGTGTSDFLGTIVTGLESQTATQPYYVFHDDDFSPVYYLQGDGEVIPDPAVAERFFAASSGSFCSGGDVSSAFEARYAAHCPTVVPGRFQKAARMYDALPLRRFSPMVKWTRVVRAGRSISTSPSALRHSPTWSWRAWRWVRSRPTR
jgi:hypothetical protein